MNGMRRELEDTLTNVTAIDGESSVRVIRSHRRPPVHSPKRVRRLVLVFAVTIGGLSLSEVRIEDSRPESITTVAAPMGAASAFDDSYVPTDLELEAEREGKAVTPPVSRSSARKDTPVILASRGVNDKIEIVVQFALAQHGDRYVWATSGPTTFDCSGLVLAAFKQIGISLPHYTGTMINKGFKVSRAELKRGDIVFPTSGHVGIYLGDNQFVHASSGQGKVVSTKLYSFYAARRIA